MIDKRKDMKRKEIIRNEAIKNADIISNKEHLENNFSYDDLIEMFESGVNYGFDSAIAATVELSAEFLNSLMPKFVNTHNVTKEEIKSYIKNRLK